MGNADLSSPPMLSLDSPLASTQQRPSIPNLCALGAVPLHRADSPLDSGAASLAGLGIVVGCWDEDRVWRVCAGCWGSLSLPLYPLDHHPLCLCTMNLAQVVTRPTTVSIARIGAFGELLDKKCRAPCCCRFYAAAVSSRSQYSCRSLYYLLVL